MLVSKQVPDKPEEDELIFGDAARALTRGVSIRTGVLLLAVRVLSVAGWLRD